MIHLSLLGAGVDVHNVEFDSFKASTPVGEIEMTNVIAKIPGARPEMVILGGHYDTKRLKMRFVGANDGASSTAFLIEMAHALAQRRNRFTYWIVLFDGQEALKDWSASDGFYGSRHFAQSLSAGQVKQIRAMFNVDMIGDRNLHIHRESHSDSQLTDLIFRDAQDLGYGRYFLERPLSVEDDHMPFVRAGIPAVELISLDYGPFNIFWHTPFDTVGKCSAMSLGIVGRVLLDALDDLESGRTPKPLLAFLESGAAGMDAIAERHRDSGMPKEEQFREDLLPLNEVCRWTDGYWDFGPGVKRKWNEIQNTSEDIQMLANYLMVQYKALVWSRPS